MRKELEMNFVILTSLSAKWRAPFRQREERLRVFSSPSSNTADETEKSVRTLRMLTARLFQ